MSSNFSTSFCGDSPFWDKELLINNTFPQFTECFHVSLIAFIPTAWLLLSGPVHVYYVKQNYSRVPIPCSMLNIIKTVLCCLLVVLTIGEGLLEIRDKEAPVPYGYYAVIGVQSVTYLFAAILTVISRKALVFSPCVLFIFWMVCVFSAIVPFYHFLNDETYSLDNNHFKVFCIWFVILCVQFILNCWAETSLLQNLNLDSDKPCSPEVYASFPSKITFHWATRIIYKGFRNALLPTDVWDLPPQYKGHVVTAKFQRSFHKLYKSHVLNTQKITSTSKSLGKSSNKAVFNPKLNSAEESMDFQEDRVTFLNHTTTEKSTHVRRKVPLAKILLKTFYSEMLISSIIRLVGDIIQFGNPALLGVLIGYIQNRDDYRDWHGYVLVAGFFTVTLLTSVFQNQNIYLSYNTGMKVKTALVATVYRKALSMTNETRRHFTTGAIVNFMAIDCQKMLDVTAQLWIMVSSPFQIGLTFYFLNETLGLSFLVGVGMLVMLIPINSRVSIAVRRYEAKQLKLKDQRLKLMNEILSGMKVIKLSAWEDSFQKKVSKTRDEEVKCLKTAALLSTFVVFIFTCSPVLVTTGTLLTYTFVSTNRYLDPATAFVALSLFNILKNPLTQLPNFISELVQGHVSLKRLSDFFSHDEISPSEVSHQTQKGIEISITNGTFTWDQTQSPTLKQVNLSVREGQLVAVMGPVGAGKSSLLCALLGEMHRLEGDISRKGTVAYVSQQAWIQNRSLKDGVIFDNPVDEKRYKDVINACALQPDIESFTGGDNTEIGENGINLSGGQKLRVALARAVYHNADVYLLDDPLSAVDSHVGKHIFKEVIGNTGMLKHKTRIMVTHGVHWLPMCDYIVVMDQGQIIQTGTFDEMMMHDGPFAQFLRTYLNQEIEEADPDIQQILGQIHTSLESLTSVSKSPVAEVLGHIHTSMESLMSDSKLSASGDHHRLQTQFSVVSKTSEKASEISEKTADLKTNSKGIQLILEERSETNRVKAHVIKSLMLAFGLVPAVITVSLLLLYNGLGIAANIWLSRWTGDEFLRNTTLAETPEYNHLTVVYVGVYAVLGVLQAVATLFFVGTLNVSMITASKRLHSNMLNTIMHQPMGFFDTNPLGRILNRFSKDVDSVDMYLTRMIRVFLLQIFIVISVLFVISYTTPIFVAAAVPLMIIYYLMQKFYMPCSRQLKRHESTSRSPIYAHFSESISGAISIRAFDATEKFRAESERLVDQNNAYSYAIISASRWLRIRLELLGNLIVVFAATFAVHGHLSASLAGLSVSYSLMVTTALNMLVQFLTQLESSIVSVERIVEYCNLKQEPPWTISENQVCKDWPTKGEVTFRDYSTRYRTGLDLVLHSLSCSIRGGQKVGVVGRTGAGKSSLSLSLFRLIEAAEGSIVIDDVTIADIGLHDLRSRLTILPQDPVLFSGTLRFNLDPLGQFTDEDLWSALGQAHLKNYVDSLAAGLDHEVDEGGLNLSVGQRQLVCLARALLRKTRILILDEATAAVDLETDELIQKTIRTAFKECTVFTVAHRLNTVMDYDRIMVLDKGNIVELDTPENLLEDINSVFYGLAKESGIVS